MNYPFWDVGLSYGLLIATISVVHVFVSHFAIGGGLYLVLAERSARNRNDSAMLDYLKGLSRAFILITLVFGALTGVAIWFVIGLTSPAATEVLIHNFVWGWAIEWTFFLVEIAAAIIYYYGWKTMSARNHMIVGWIYFAAAWLSLAVINGILAFMLTPGDWITTGDFWDGFLNPTYFSTTVFRTGICLLMASVFSLMAAALYKASDFKARIVRYNTLWGIAGLVIMAPSFYWFWQDIPAPLMAHAQATMRIPFEFVNGMYWLGAVLTALLLVFGIALARQYHVVTGAVIMALGLVWFGSFEFFRESVRKPWVITDYIYANGIEAAELPKYQRDGMLAHMPVRTGDDGADLYRRACRSCHTIDGYHPLKPAFDGTDETYIAAVVQGTHVLHGNMPPFAGTPEEAKLIAAHIWKQVDQRPLTEIYPLQGIELGRQVYDVRCGRCHVLGGFDDKTASLAGLSREDYEDILNSADDLGEEMPAFTGDELERNALIEFMLTLKEGGQK